MSAPRAVLNWPVTDETYLTLDLECDFGTALSENTFQAAAHTDRLVALLERLDVPLTVFVQTELLGADPGAVERLRDADVRTHFYPHSHTHQRRERTDVDFEVRESTERYRRFFGHDPAGYRFPDGAIRPVDYRTLAEHGYQFDASIFPTVRPGQFDNTEEPTTPSYYPDANIIEIPFTLYSDRIRVPTALSYCRVVGRPFSELLLRRPPPVMVFNVHMHDLKTPPAYRRLSPMYKAIYARNDGRGFQMLEAVIRRLRDAGMTFETLESVHARLREIPTVKKGLSERTG
jgi:peptidoglycan/xylan/chitin deacetylase (PgdA/CDA1 family)